MNALKDPRFCNNELVTGPPNVVFYAGAALLIEGQKVGSLCIIDSKPRECFSLHEKQLLFDLATLVSNCMSWSRVTNMGSLRQTQLMLSLTHNINTLMTGLSLQIESLLTEVTSATYLADKHEVVIELVSKMNMLRAELVTRVGHALSVGKSLPYLTTSFGAIADASAYGACCDLRNVLESVSYICGICYPKFTCVTDVYALENTTQECFVDTLYVGVCLALKAAVPDSNSVGSIDIRFAEYDWSIENAAAKSTEQRAVEHIGDIVFTLQTAAVTDFKQLEDEGMVSFLDAICGSQNGSISNGQLHYTLRVPCRLTEILASKESAVTEAEAVRRSDENELALRVLIVDDDKAFSEQLQRVLVEEYGCVVEIAPNGKLGQICYNHSISENKVYNLMFVDLLMPSVDGIEMMRRITNQYGSINEATIVIAMIGVADQCDQFMEDCNGDPASYGFSFVVLKPLDIMFLQQVLKSTAESETQAVSELDEKVQVQSQTKPKKRKYISEFGNSISNRKFIMWSFFDFATTLKIHPP